ncbi:hypothetical protein AXG93_638s1460 [Marchantia polymorpha subsp. ruderalis]|nr:hypothetical protein AXG93_638s1460 [Marchantia polymorpha subsp. ruderalis]
MENNLILTLEALASSGCIVPSEMRCAIQISLKYKKRDAGLRSLSLWGRIFTAGGKDYLLAEGVKSIKLVKRKLVFDTRYYFSQNGAVWLDLQSPSDEQFDLCKKIKGPFRGDPSHLYFVPDPPPPPLPPPGPETTMQPAFLTPTTAVAEEGEGDSKEEDSATEGESEMDEDSDGPPPPAEAQVETDEEGPDPELNPEEDNGEPAEPPPPKGQDVGELVRLASLMRWVDEDCGVVPIGGMVLDAHNNLVQNVVFPG